MRDIQNIIEISKHAGKEILKIYDSLSPDEIITKDDNSPLTKADLASHNYIVKELLRISPDIPVLSEESVGISYEQRSSRKTYRCVDPLDGTKEFIKQNGEFTVNIALIESGVPVLGVVHRPVGGQSRYAYDGKSFLEDENGVTPISLRSLDKKCVVVGSRSHQSQELLDLVESIKLKGFDTDFMAVGSSLKICMVAQGLADLYPRLGLTSERDTAAAHAVVLGAGGDITTKEGASLSYNKENILNPHFIVASRSTKETLGL